MSEGLPHLLQIRGLTPEPAQRRLSVADGRGDGLFHFVGDRGRELPHGCDAIGVRQLHLHVAISALGLACLRFRTLALAQIEHEGDGLLWFFADRGAADQHGHAAAVFAEVFLLAWLDRSGSRHFRHPPHGIVAPFRRREDGPAHAACGEILTIVPDDVEKCVVGLENSTFHVPDENSHDVSVDQAPDFRFASFDLSVQPGQRFQVGLQQVAKVQQELEISLAIGVPFVIANANGPEYLAIGPADRDPQIRDHP